MQYELGGIITTTFATLGLKIYSYLTDDNDEC